MELQHGVVTDKRLRHEDLCKFHELMSLGYDGLGMDGYTSYIQTRHTIGFDKLVFIDVYRHSEYLRLD